MAKRGMPQIVRQRNGLDQVLVEAQGPGDRARDLRNLQGMGQPRAKQIAFMVDEDLGLVDQAPKGTGVDDAIAIALKR